MGKGDKKTKRGKIVNGSYGRLRPKKKRKNKYVKPAVQAETTPEKKVEVSEEAPKAKKTTTKKTTTKKTTAKKTTTKKTTTKKTTAKAKKEEAATEEKKESKE